MPGFLYQTGAGERVYVPEGEAPPPDSALLPGQTATYYDDAGNQQTVAAEDYLGAVQVQAGQFNQRQLAPTEDAVAAEDAYWREQTYDTLGNEVVAGLTGLASGATLGLSDLALEGMGVGSQVADIRDVNSSVSLAGEIVGSFAGLGKAGGLLAKAGALTPAAQATKLGTSIAKGRGLAGAIGGAAAEGALFGAGQGVSNLALSDKPLTAESMFNEIGMNSIYGAGLGGVFGAAGHGMSRAGEKLFRRGEEGLDSIYAGTVADRLRGSSDELNKAFKEIDDISEQALRKGVGRDTIVEGAAAKVDEVFDEGVAKNVSNAYSKQMAMADEVINKYGVKGTESLRKRALEARKEVESILKGRHPEGKLDWAKLNNLDDAERKAFKDAWDNFGKQVDNYVSLAKVDDAGIDLGQKYGGTAGDKTAVKGGDGESVIGALRSTPITKKPLAKEFPEVTSLPEAAKELQTAHKAYKEAIPDLDSFLSKEPDDALRSLQVYDDYMKQLKKAAPDEEIAARLAANQEEVQRIINTALKREDAAGVADLAKMAAIFGVEEAVLPDIGGPVGTMLELYIAHKAVKGLGGKKAGKLGSMMRNAAKSAGRRAAGFGAQGPGGILVQEGTRQVYGQAAGRAFDFLAGGLDKMGSTVARSSAIIQKNLGRSLKAAGKVTKRATPAGVAIMDASFGPDAETKPKDVQHAFQLRSEELGRAMSNLPAFQERVHNNLANVRSVNMEVGDYMAAHAVQAAQFLYEKMPKDPGTLQKFGRSRWKPSERELEKWGRYVRAVKEGPAQITERFANGRMTREDAEVLKTVYPAAFAKVQEWMMDNMEAIQEKVPYERRIQWSVLMGVTGDPMMQRVDRWQANFADKPPESPQQQTNIQNNQKPTMAQQLTGALPDV